MIRHLQMFSTPLHQLLLKQRQALPRNWLLGGDAHRNLCFRLEGQQQEQHGAEWLRCLPQLPD